MLGDERAVEGLGGREGWEGERAGKEKELGGRRSWEGEGYDWLPLLNSCRVWSRSNWSLPPCSDKQGYPAWREGGRGHEGVVLYGMKMEYC